MNATKLKIAISALIVICVTLFVVVILGVSGMGDRHALHKTEDLLSYSCADLPNTLRANHYSTLLLQAEILAGKLKLANPPNPAEMRKIVGDSLLDELYLVNNYGKVMAAVDPAIVGRDLSTIPSMIEFLSLLESPDLIVEQPIRLSIANPESGVEVSYCGFPQKDGSLILCGITVERLRQNFIRSGADIMSTWAIGDSGGYAVVDDATGKLVFDIQEKAKTGERFADIGDPAAMKAAFDVDATYVGTILGTPCHYRVFDCYGLRTIVFVAHDEFFASVKVTVWTVAILMLFVFSTFAAVLHRVIATGRAINRMHEAVERQRLKDMMMATSIQKHSLPTMFPPYPDHVDKFDIFAFMQPAKEVGGDFYDFYFAGKDRLALVVADVSGKGVPAAMFMMRAKTTIQGLLKSGRPLIEAISTANTLLCEGNLEDMFVTAWVGLCDLRTGEVEYVNAGHNPPVIRRADGSVEWECPRPDLVLAAMEGATYRPHKFTLGPGDGLILYTDGVTEAQDAAGALYGKDRLERLIGGMDSEKDARRWCDGVLEALLAFAGTAEQADDITVLAFRLKRLLTR